MGPIPERWEVKQPFQNPGYQVIERGEIANLHFNGIYGGAFFSLENGVSRFCSEKSCMKNKEQMIAFKSPWALAEYYVYLPWKWVLYMGRSFIPLKQKGFPLVIHHHTNHTDKEKLMAEISGNWTTFL